MAFQDNCHGATDIINSSLFISPALQFAHLTKSRQQKSSMFNCYLTAVDSWKPTGLHHKLITTEHWLNAEKSEAKVSHI